jgi:hypothetical protein
MIRQETIEAINKAIKFKYDEHVSKLLSIPNAHLARILPNRGLSTEILGGFNKDTGKELSRYGDDIRSEVSRVIEKLKLNEFSGEDKKIILNIVEKYCNPDLYLKRFEIMLSSIERKTSSYGQKINLIKKSIDIPRSICEVYARNTTRRIISKIENDLDFFIESFISNEKVKESKVSEVTNCLELKPNFFGLGLNLNAIIDKFLNRKKT